MQLTASTTSGLAMKVNIADTATMLAPYAYVNDVNNLLALATQDLIDTLAVINYKIDLKLDLADTADMLAPYLRATEANTSIATKLNIADTSAMLSG